MPDWAQQLLTSALIPLVLGAIGGFASGYFFPMLLQNHKFKLDERLADHQNRLKWQEMLFERRLAAADAVILAIDKIIPGFSSPDMTHDEACEEIASDIGPTEMVLANLLRLHSVGLADGVRQELVALRDLAAENKFFELEGPEDKPPASAISAAEEIWSGLTKVEQMLFDQIKSIHNNI